MQIVRGCTLCVVIYTSEHRCRDMHKAGGRPRVYKADKYARHISHLFRTRYITNHLDIYLPHGDSSTSDSPQDTPSRIHIVDTSKPSNRRPGRELVGSTLWDSCWGCANQIDCSMQTYHEA